MQSHRMYEFGKVFDGYEPVDVEQNVEHEPLRDVGAITEVMLKSENWGCIKFLYTCWWSVIGIANVKDVK